ncbi:hypothetical protein V6N13_113478 [Hibiscus sabdariffa]
MMVKGAKKLGKYEIGRTIGEGTFAKVKFAKNTDTGENVAIKVLAKTTILKHGMIDQEFWLFYVLYLNYGWYDYGYGECCNKEDTRFSVSGGCYM